MNRRRLLVLAATLAAIAVLLAVSGGVRATVGGFRISARSPLPAAVLAAAVLGAWWALARRAASVTADLDAAWPAIERHAKPAIALAAAISGTVAAVFAANSASGADASGYLSQADQWAAGRLYHPEPLAGLAGALDPWLTVPLGWRPAPFPGWQSPTYPPGLPLLMALPHALGGATGAGFVVAFGAAVATAATGLLAARLAGGAAGILAAVIIATSPVFLFQSVQPMSDVPVTAAWMLMWLLLARPGGTIVAAGLACGVAVLVRPNLAPLAAIPLFAIGTNTRRLIAFSVPVAIAGAALMWLQWQWYGSPLRSGYGSAAELFTVANAGANASRYLAWLTATSPVLLLAPIGAALLWRERPARALTGFAVLVAAAYLVYAVFDTWSYLRFLLPGLAAGSIFAAAAIVAVLRRLPASARAAMLLIVALGLGAQGVAQARALSAFRLAEQQRRVAQVAEFIATKLPAETVIIAGEQSGSLRYYTGRSILRWDAAAAESLSAALVALAAAGTPVVIALDAWEREPFRARFSAADHVSLAWPPAFEAGTSHRTQVWRLSDRDRFLRGERVASERVP